MTAKIEYAIAATALFINNLHSENFDRGMIATFGNSFRVDCGFTATESYLHSALRRLSPSEIKQNNEGTRLYDSIENCIFEFHRYGRRDRPWLLIVITDGKDYYDQGKYRNNPAAIGRFIANSFNHEPTNFIVVVGVGEGNEIDRNALATMANNGGFKAVTLGAFQELQMLFLAIALQVSNQISGVRYSVGNMSWTEVRRIRQLNRVAIDYAFLLDRSGSMSGPG